MDVRHIHALNIDYLAPPEKPVHSQPKPKAKSVSTAKPVANYKSVPTSSQIYKQTQSAANRARESKRRADRLAKRILPVMTRVKKPCCARPYDEFEQEEDTYSASHGYFSPSVSGTKFFPGSISDDAYRRSSYEMTSGAALRRQLAEEYFWLKKQVYELRKQPCLSDQESSRYLLFPVKSKTPRRHQSPHRQQSPPRRQRRKGWAQAFSTRDFRE